jgi:hypothetical protein
VEGNWQLAIGNWRLEIGEKGGLIDVVLRLDGFSGFFAFCRVRPSWTAGNLMIVLFMNVFMIVYRSGGVIDGGEGRGRSASRRHLMVCGREAEVAGVTFGMGSR